MTVQSAASRNSYIASGGTTFAYTFLAQQSTDLAVYDAGVLVATSAYTVTGVGAAAGGSVIFTVAPTSGHSIVILSAAAYTQGVDLVDNDPFAAATLEGALDRDTILSKQLKEITDRALKFDVFACDANIAVDSVVGKAGKVLAVASGETRAEWITVSQAQAAATGNFTATGTGAVSRTVSAKLGDFVSVKDFGAIGNDIVDDRASVQAALDASLNVYFPAGTYRLTAAITIRQGHRLWGAGRTVSIVRADHNGDGIQSTWPINGSTAVHLSLADLGITCTNGTNTGGGFADVAGTFIYLDRVRISGFKYEVIFDQTEIGYIADCDLEAGAANAAAGLWLVNGADHTALASPYFTNVIAVRNTQFNAAGTAVNVIDDGGVTHHFEACNFNAGARAMQVAAVSGLRIEGCHSENHTSIPFTFSDTTVGGTFRRLPSSIDITTNAIADAVTYHLQFFAAQGVAVTRNTFGQYTTAAAVLSADKVTDFTFRDNDKIIQGTSRTAAGFLDGTTARLQAANYTQRNQTYATSGSIVAGTRTITPATMGFAGSPEHIDVGDTLYCVSTDGTNAEIVTVAATTASTFTAVFASAKDATFLIIGATKLATASGTPYVHGLYTQSLVKGWVVFDGTAANPITPVQSYNVTAPIWKNAAGDYTITWDRDFSCSRYAIAGMGQRGTAGLIDMVVELFTCATAMTVGEVHIQTQVAGARADSNIVTLIAFGPQ